MLTFIVQGLLMGAVYGLIALSLTLIFGILKVINFTHGQLLMVAMFVTYFLCVSLNANPYVVALLSALIMFVVGYAIQRSLIQPVLTKNEGVRNPIASLLLTAGIGIVLENFTMVVFGSNYRSLGEASAVQTVSLGNVLLPLPRIYAFIAAVICTVAFYLFLQKTETGRIIRAVGLDRTTAKLMGINVTRTFAISYGLGCASLGICGAVMLPFYYVHPSLGLTFGNLALVTVVLGGLGSIPGAIISGLIIGVVQSVASMFVPNTLSMTVVFYLFLLFVFIRPQGLLGSKHDW